MVAVMDTVLDFLSSIFFGLLRDDPFTYGYTLARVGQCTCMTTNLLKKKKTPTWMGTWDNNNNNGR